MRAHDGDMFDDEEDYSMPPFDTNRTIWHGVNRKVLKLKDDTAPKSKSNKVWSVVVTFTRVGYSNETQQRVTEELPRHVIATKMGPQQADALYMAIMALCDDTYSQGYSDGRKRAAR
jgi:hypothetical protein